MTKYGPFRMLQIMHMLHRERKTKSIINVGSHGGRRELGNTKKMFTQCICFMPRSVYKSLNHGINHWLNIRCFGADSARSER